MSRSARAIGPSTLVLTLQNGLGNIESLLAHVPAARLLAAAKTYDNSAYGQYLRAIYDAMPP